MFDSILVAIDGSDAARNAASAAITLATACEATVTAVHVVDTSLAADSADSDVASSIDRAAEQFLAEVAEIEGASSIPLETKVLHTDTAIATELIRAAESVEADCIVMGTTGRTGLSRLALGSIAARTLRYSPVPVFTLHAERPLPSAINRLMVATDGSEGAEAAIDFAIDFAGTFDARIDIVSVVDVTGIGVDEGGGVVFDSFESAAKAIVDAAADRVTAAGIEQVTGEVLVGQPARAITDAAEDGAVDLLVMGTHGRTGFDRLLLGSATEAVIRETTLPVVGVKHPDRVKERLSDT